MLEGNLLGVGMRSIFCWEPWSYRERYILREAGLPGHPEVSTGSEEQELLRRDTESVLGGEALYWGTWQQQGQ